MIKICKICLLTEGEISELNKQLEDIKSQQRQFASGLARNDKDHDTISRMFDRFDMKNVDRIKRMADIIMPTLPIAKRKALAKLFDGPKKAVAVAVSKQSDAEPTKTESK